MTASYNDAVARALLAILEPLTTVELTRVLPLLALGLSNREIALRLGMARSTVGNHVHAIIRKMRSSSRTEAVYRSSLLGLVTRGSREDGLRALRVRLVGRY